MQSSDQEVLQRAYDWCQQGHHAHLLTVMQTWGSAPRLPGAILVVRDDGHLVGSVSGGCIEDDLVEQAKAHALPTAPAMLEYGVNRAEAQRFGIPCGGQLKLFCEPLRHASQLTPMLESLAQRQLLKRSVHVHTGEVKVQTVSPEGPPRLEGDWFHSYFGPQWRLLIIGANQLGSVLARMAQALDFHVLICDPREEMRAEWQVSGADWLAGMPDDVVVQMRPDPHTAIVAVTHDPKLDDMALLEALVSDAFYVGALGARKNQEKRKQRLRSFALSEQQVNRLHGPVGLPIGSRTPAEIAVSILAELVQERAAMQQATRTSTVAAAAA